MQIISFKLMILWKKMISIYFFSYARKNTATNNTQIISTTITSAKERNLNSFYRIFIIIWKKSINGIFLPVTLKLYWASVLYCCFDENCPFCWFGGPIYSLRTIIRVFFFIQFYFIFSAMLSSPLLSANLLSGKFNDDDGRLLFCILFLVITIICNDDDDSYSKQVEMVIRPKHQNDYRKYDNYIEIIWLLSNLSNSKYRSIQKSYLLELLTFPFKLFKQIEMCRLLWLKCIMRKHLDKFAYDDDYYSFFFFLEHHHHQVSQ